MMTMSGMTREEAIRLLGVIDTICTMRMGDYGEREHNAMLMAIADMEKQIPKKPLETKGDTFAMNKDGKECYFILCDCPSCKKRLKAYQLHCECGQALEWGEEND